MKKLSVIMLVGLALLVGCQKDQDSKTQQTVTPEQAVEHPTTAPEQQTAPAASTATLPSPAKSEPDVSANADSTSLSLTGDAARGEKLAGKCKACHNLDASNKIGPGLQGVFGRKAGTMPGMKYSSSLVNGGWVWDEAHLGAWICDSKKAVKAFTNDSRAKTKMAAQRICDPQKQADLIAFLKTL